MPALILLAPILWLPLGPRVADEPSRLEREPDGWIDLLAEGGPDLKGWTRVPIPPRDALKEPSPWKLDAAGKLLVCDGVGHHEWLRFDREFADAVLHVEWRFVPVAGGQGYNSGVMLRCSADGKVWHQAQTGDASGGHLFGETPGPDGGKLAFFDLSKRVQDGRVKPAGEWNTFEAAMQGRSMSLWVNGARTCAFDGVGPAAGFVGLEAEFYRVEFRNVKLKPLPREL